MVEVNENRPVAIQVSGVKKMYRLGQIGGGTLQADLQSWFARVRGKEDPNTKIGEGERIKGQTFMALNGIDLTIYQGEAVGIIGGNGAGKSTLLKLLSKVTAPTEGEIDIYGRIASMLEVGTGFNGELTGRENVYMNGAILGMTKQEIDAKMEQIIEFSEVRDFIDTPVKRYSSGMFVKLAFSVAAHLDSEIMIMDEVLAVGDMAFQKKCLEKMREAAKKDGRTVLYVSHNMNTIRQLCDRSIVLDKGKVVFEGDVDGAIGLYLGTNSQFRNCYQFTKEQHSNQISDDFLIQAINIYGNDQCQFELGDIIRFDLSIALMRDYSEVRFRVVVDYSDGTHAGTMMTNNALFLKKSHNQIIEMEMDTAHLMKGTYRISISAFVYDKFGNQMVIDGVYPAFYMELIEKVSENHPVMWLHQYWGHIRLNDVIAHVK